MRVWLVEGRSNEDEEFTPEGQADTVVGSTSKKRLEVAVAKANEEPRDDKKFQKLRVMEYAPVEDRKEPTKFTHPEGVTGRLQ